MSTEQNKDVVRRFIDEVFVKCNVDAADELATPDFTPHSWPGVEPGIEKLKQGQRRVSAGLADVSMKIEDMIAEGDKVAVRLTAHARQEGEFMGLPASGREYTISETHIFRVSDGKVAEHWVNADMLGLMRQLGALPDQARKAS
ncbi:MAG: ester cyclase [Chloroflexota bacterium]